MIKYIFPLIALILGLLIVFLPHFMRMNQSDNKFSLLNSFPFETPIDYRTRIIYLLLFGLFTLMCAESYSSALFIPSKNIGMISALILFIISDIAMFGSICFTLEYYRYHIIADAIFFVTKIGAGLTLCITCLTSELYIEFTLWISIVIGVISLICLGLLFIPKLKKWMYLEKSEMNGHVTYIRPKVSILALVEWIFIIAEIVIMLLLVINGVLLM